MTASERTLLACLCILATAVSGYVGTGLLASTSVSLQWIADTSPLQFESQKESEHEGSTTDTSDEKETVEKTGSTTSQSTSSSSFRYDDSFSDWEELWKKYLQSSSSQLSSPSSTKASLSSSESKNTTSVYLKDGATSSAMSSSSSLQKSDREFWDQVFSETLKNAAGSSTSSQKQETGDAGKAESSVSESNRTVEEGVSADRPTLEEKSVSSNARSEPTITTTIQRAVTSDQPKILICYTQRGELTSDRSQCAPDQTSFIRAAKVQEGGNEPTTVRNLTPEQEQIIDRKLNERFHAVSEVAQKRKALIQLMQEVRLRLQGLLGSGAIDEANKEVLTQQISWLGTQIEYFDSNDRTLQEIKATADIARTFVKRAEKLLALVRQESSVPANAIDDLTIRVGHLIAQFYQAIIIATKAQVPLDISLYGQYEQARLLYLDVREHCPTNRDSCSQLRIVIDSLASMKQALEQAIDASDNSTVHDEIEALSQ